MYVNYETLVQDIYGHIFREGGWRAGSVPDAPSVTSISRDPVPSSGLHKNQACTLYIYIHAGKILILIK